MKTILITTSALTGLPQYLPMLRKWDKTKYEKEFKWFKDADRNHYRIFFPFKYDPKTVTVLVPEAVQTALQQLGYQVHDYAAGLAKKIVPDQRNPVRIGKLLPESSKAAQAFRDSRHGLQRLKTQDFEVVISRHPYDLAGMSTGRDWESCQTLTDKRTKKFTPTELNRYVKTDICAGSLLAYLIPKTAEVGLKHSRNIAKPLCRVKIYRYENAAGHYLLKPSTTVYGVQVAHFVPTVQKICKVINHRNQVASGNYQVDSTQVYVDRDDHPQVTLLIPTVEEAALVTKYKQALKITAPGQLEYVIPALRYFQQDAALSKFLRWALPTANYLTFTQILTQAQVTDQELIELSADWSAQMTDGAAKFDYLCKYAFKDPKDNSKVILEHYLHLHSWAALQLVMERRDNTFLFQREDLLTLITSSLTGLQLLDLYRHGVARLRKENLLDTVEHTLVQDTKLFPNLYRDVPKDLWFKYAPTPITPAIIETILLNMDERMVQHCTQYGRTDILTQVAAYQDRSLPNLKFTAEELALVAQYQAVVRPEEFYRQNTVQKLILYTAKWGNAALLPTLFTKYQAYLSAEDISVLIKAYPAPSLLALYQNLATDDLLKQCEKRAQVFETSFIPELYRRLTQNFELETMLAIATDFLHRCNFTRVDAALPILEFFDQQGMLRSAVRPLIKQLEQQQLSLEEFLPRLRQTLT